MFNLFKKHNKIHNPMSTTDAAYADPKDAFAKFAAAYDDFMRKNKGVANPPLILKASCRNDACTEPSKRLVGGGFYNDGGAITIESIKQGKSKHFNTYKCDKFEECRNKCNNDTIFGKS